MYWAERNNQPKAEKSYQNAEVGKYYNSYIVHLCLLLHNFVSDRLIGAV